MRLVKAKAARNDMSSILVEEVLDPKKEFDHIFFLEYSVLVSCGYTVNKTLCRRAVFWA